MVSLLATVYASDEKVAGIIEQVQCRAELMERLGHNSIRLDPKRDIGRSLFPGDSVVCTSSGWIQLLVFGRVVKINHPGIPYPIPYVRPQHLSDEEQMRQSALEDYSRRGGRERSGEEPEGASVTLKFFYILLPVIQGGPLSVSIQNKIGKEIWHGNVTSSTGLLESAEASDAIGQYQQSGGGQLTVLISQNDKQQQISYYVLSREAEKQLEAALAVWDGEQSGLMRHIGRASVFSDALLFEAAGREYEAALADAPESGDLRQAAVEEYRRAGDDNRANNLGIGSAPLAR
jgi:hypothetical protein